MNQYFSLIRKLMTAGLETKSIHLIGHSLGAHICSYVGANLGGVGRITGETMI
jgi:triacylglycerol esterase/lipase EstA (alpha/beta hydrolase family)